MRWVEARGERCVYCGDRANTTEHFPPQTVESGGWLLSACSECNSFAEAEHPFNLDARAEHVKAKLRARYRRVLNYATFDDDDLASFSGALKQEVEACVRAKKRAQRRIAWSVDRYFELIDQPKPFAASVAASHGITCSESETRKRGVRREKSRYTLSCSACGRTFVTPYRVSKWCRECADRPKVRKAILELFA